MKKIALTLTALIPFWAMAQTSKTPVKPQSDNFTVKGNIKNLKDGNTVYLVYQASATPSLDSAKTLNGSFNFKGNIAMPTRAALFLNSNPLIKQPTESTDYLSFYIEPANIVISAADSLKNSSVSGSKTNEEDKKLKDALNPVFTQMRSLQAEFARYTEAEKKDSAVMVSFKNKYEAVALQMPSKMEQFIKENSNSYISLLLCAEMANNASSVPTAKKLFAGLNPEIKKTDLAQRLAQFFAQPAAAQKPAVGEMAKDFTQNDVNNKPVKLSDFKGKYVLLDFWASWCGPCRHENPNVVAAYNKFKDKGFTVLGVSLDKASGKEDWLNAIKNDNLTWTQVSDLKAWENEVARMYGINSIPANFLIDPNGKIIATDLREKDLHNKLEEILGK